MATIFTQIINGTIPAYKIYEDEYTFAFLDIFPQIPGHTLIVPKIEIDHFADVPEPYYSAIFQTAKKLTPALQQATGCSRICTAFVGYEIPHVHYHLLPTNSMQDMQWKQATRAQDDTLLTLQKAILSYI